MPLFGKKRQTNEINNGMIREMAELEAGLETVKADFAAFEKKVVIDLEGLRRDFKELVLFLQDSNESESSDQTAGRDHPEAQNEAPNVQPDLGLIREDLNSLNGRVETLAQWIQTSSRDIAVVLETVCKESKTVQEAILTARKDIKSKITYAVSRIRA